MPAIGAEDRTVVATAVVASCLSIAGSLFIIISWLASSSRMFFLRLIMLLSIANLLSSFSYALSVRLLIDASSSDTLCQLQAWTMTIFESASVLWTLVIACTLHEQVVGKRGDVERLEPLYHALCWGLPLAMAIAMSMSSELGPATPEHTDWCWIAGGAGASRPRADWAQLGVFYIPLVLAFGANVVVYLRVSSAFGALSAEGAVDPSKGQMVQLRLRLYLGVFILLLDPSTDPFALRLLHAALSPAMGFLNAMVYGWNDKVLRPYRDALAVCRQWYARRRGASGDCASSTHTFASPSAALLGSAGGAGTAPVHLTGVQTVMPLRPATDTEQS